MTKIILASGSPRRKTLLGQIYSDFEVIPSSYEEEGVQAPEPSIQAMALAYLKAQAVRQDHEEALVIGADTLISLEGEVLGKPSDREDAKNILERLSGRTHQVISGYALISPGAKYVDFAQADVTFKDLDEGAIEAYLDTGEYVDKAGAYGIQGQGRDLVSSYEGDINTIIGLPVKDLKRALGAYGLLEED